MVNDLTDTHIMINTHRINRRTGVSLMVFYLLSAGQLHAQTGSVYEPVRYVGGVTIDPRPHEARLRPAIGVHNHQVMRSNRSHPEWSDGHGWTYNHAPSLAYWNAKFYHQYLSNPVGEHLPPGQTLVCTSVDGRDWSAPVVAFPPYEPPEGTTLPKGATGYMMHQRMGFYLSPNDRLLLLAFYGHSENPFGPGGIGRVVRETYADGRMGLIYFIRYSSHTDFDETNTSYPFYASSSDEGFVAACDALLADKLMTLQWWDEDRGRDGYYTVREAGSALSFFHRADGKVVAMWKFARSALSTDEGTTFSKPVRVPTLTMSGGKVWGQRTDDKRYALVYNPIDDSEHRYPLVVVTSDDGIIFDDMLLLHSEVPPRRYYGKYKDFGPQYNRGIAEGNGNPPGDDLWLTYSVNKEDMWVSRLPVPVQYEVDHPVDDDFDETPLGGNVPNWNVYDAIWAPVRVSEGEDSPNHTLRLEDRDPYDYARAVRVFQEGTSARVMFRILAEQTDTGELEIELMDRFGNRPIRLAFTNSGKIDVNDGSQRVTIGEYVPNQWYEFELTIDATVFGSYDLTIDGEQVMTGAALAEAVQSVERLSFRTGAFRTRPTRRTESEIPEPDLEGADEPVPTAVFHIDDVSAMFH